MSTVTPEGMLSRLGFPAFLHPQHEDLSILHVKVLSRHGLISPDPPLNQLWAV